MKKLFLFLILSAVFLCCLSFASAEGDAADHPIPVEIRSLAVGDKASLEFANTGDSDLLLVTFRFRGWDAEGKIVNIFEAAEAEPCRRIWTPSCCWMSPASPSWCPAVRIPWICPRAMRL